MDRDRSNALIMNSCNGTKSSSTHSVVDVPLEKYIEMKRRFKIKVKKAIIFGIVVGIGIGGIGGVALGKSLDDLHEKAEISQEIASNVDVFADEYLEKHQTEDPTNADWFLVTEKASEGILNFHDVNNDSYNYERNVYICEEAIRATSNLNNADIERNMNDILRKATDDEHNYEYLVEHPDGTKDDCTFANYLFENGFYEDVGEMSKDDALRDPDLFDSALSDFRKTKGNINKLDVASMINSSDEARAMVDNSFEEATKSGRRL